MKKQMLTILLIVVGMLIGTGGCAGRDAHPISTQKVGDRSLSCESLGLLISSNEATIIRKTKQDESKLWSNVFWLVWFPPLMDVKGAEKCEAEALRERNNYLTILMSEKGCQ